MIEKVFAYITRNNHLLVFVQPDSETGIINPAAGIQVPGGTINAGEQPVDAVMREVYEETGLVELRLDSYLGDIHYTYDPSVYGREVIHHRYFYHVICNQDTPTTWRTIEKDPSDDPGHIIILEFYWVSLLSEIPDLVAGQGMMLDKLIAKMNIR